ncbi:hypothetical protein ACC754_40270, partial [Rhizobium johnstonii]
MAESMKDLTEARNFPNYAPPPVQPPPVSANQPVFAAEAPTGGPFSTGVTPAKLSLLAELLPELKTVPAMPFMKPT